MLAQVFYFLHLFFSFFQLCFSRDLISNILQYNRPIKHVEFIVFDNNLVEHSIPVRRIIIKMLIRAGGESGLIVCSKNKYLVSLQVFLYIDICIYVRVYK